MSKFNKPYNNFQFGQVSPKFAGRFDTQEYQNAMETLENGLVGKLGGLFKRPGSHSINDIVSAEDIQFIPIQVGNQTHFLWVYKNFPITIGDGTTSNLYAGIGVVQVFGPLVAGPTLVLNNRPLDTYDTPTGGELTTPFPFGKWQYVQYGNTVTVTHGSGLQKPFIIVADDSNPLMTFLNIEYYTSVGGANGGPFSPPLLTAEEVEVLRRPYLDANITPTTITPSATGAAGVLINLTCSAADVLKEGHVYRITHAGVEGAALVISNTTSTVSSAIPIVAFGAITASDNWRESAWGKYNWPKTVEVYDQRFAFGGSSYNQDKIWLTVKGNIYVVMSPKFVQDATTDVSGLRYFGPSADSDAFNFTPDSANEIRWSGVSKSLAIGTSKTEHTFDGGQSILKFDSINPKTPTSWGGSYVRAIQVGSDIIFADTNGILRTFRYSDENGSYVSKDIGSFSEGIILNKVDQLAWTPSKNIVWVLDNDGKLSSATYSSDFLRIAWSRNPLGQGTDVEVLSIHSYENLLHMIVKRNGKYIYEVIDLDYEPTSISDFKYLDSYQTSIPIVLNTTNLNTWFNDNEIYGYLDGIVYGPFTAALGVIAGLPNVMNGKSVLFGYKYQMKGKTLPVEAGGEFGVGQGQMMRIDTVTARLYKSYLGIIRGAESANTEQLSDGTQLVTDDSRIPLPQSPTRKNQVYFESTIGMPLNILSLTFTGANNNK